MKKILSVCLLGAALASCGSADKSYEINGSFNGNMMDSTTLYLMNGDSIIDTAMVAEGKYAFKGEVDSIAHYRVASKMMMRGQERFQTLAKVILEQGAKVNINVDKEVVVDDNNGVNHIWSQFIIDYRAANEKLMGEYRTLIDNKASMDSLNLFREHAISTLGNLWKEAVAANKDNLAGTAIFSDFCGECETPAIFDSIYSSLKNVELFPSLVAQKEYYSHLAATAEGQMFVDFGGKDLNGDAVKLSDYVGKGKYVLVDFWASWCGPCRAEIPNLIAVNKKFGGENFTVLGVNVWDQEDAFKASMEKEKIDYQQIFASENHDATTFYGIRGIPQIMLFAPDGTIVKRDLRGEAIEATVKECLKK